MANQVQFRYSTVQDLINQLSQAVKSEKVNPTSDCYMQVLDNDCYVEPKDVESETQAKHLAGRVSFVGIASHEGSVILLGAQIKKKDEP